MELVFDCTAVFHNLPIAFCIPHFTLAPSEDKTEDQKQVAFSFRASNIDNWIYSISPIQQAQVFYQMEM